MDNLNNLQDKWIAIFLFLLFFFIWLWIRDERVWTLVIGFFGAVTMALRSSKQEDYKEDKKEDPEKTLKPE